MGYFVLFDEVREQCHSLPILNRPIEMDQETIQRSLCGEEEARSIKCLGYTHDIEYDPFVGEIYGFTLSEEASEAEWANIRKTWKTKLEELGFTVGEWLSFL